MKISWSLLPLLSVVCVAQVPIPAPRLSENFIGRSRIFRSGQVEFIDGTEVWAHSIDGKKAMVKDGLIYRTHSVWRQHIRLFDKLVQYTVTLSDSEHIESCTSSKISENADFPLVWNWLQQAHYEDYIERGTNTTYPSWKLHTRTGSIQLVVKNAQMEPVIPYLLIDVMNAGDVQEKEFYEYSVGVPSDELFEVPPECLQKN